jgi:hypothetical protein
MLQMPDGNEKPAGRALQLVVYPTELLGDAHLFEPVWARLV